jgi:hypothetical protein
MANGRIEFAFGSEEDVAYISLPDHPCRGVGGVVEKLLRLRDLVGDYEGPDLYFDFDKENRLIRIESWHSYFVSFTCSECENAQKLSM